MNQKNETQSQIFKVKLMAWDKVSGNVLENSLSFIADDEVATKAKTYAKEWAKEEHIGQHKEIRIVRDCENVFSPAPLVRWDNFREAAAIESRKNKAWSMGIAGKRMRVGKKK